MPRSAVTALFMVTPADVVASVARLAAVIKPVTGVETPPTAVVVHGAVVQPKVLSKRTDPVRFMAFGFNAEPTDLMM